MSEATSVAPPVAPETEESIPLLLSDVTRMFWRRLEGAMQRHGLDFTAGEARALVHAFKAASLRQTSLAERMCIEPMTLVGVIDRLEKRGLLERVACPRDRRAKLVKVTKDAEPVVERILVVAAGVKAEVSAGLSPEEVDTLLHLLARIRHNLRELPPEEAATP
ncbi:MAG: MarR family transcriptional regulator [Ancalomicrobiaceae bacterium]|nr:MarR family transcriptional regulator [Ancalomicrobiaceae bacterium]